MSPQPRSAAGRLDVPDTEPDYAPEQSIGYLVRTTFRRMAPLLRTQLAADRVTVGMWYFLRALWEGDGLTQRELTEQVDLMQPTTAAAVRGMQKRGLITVERDRSDRRRVRIFLTPEGRRLKRRLMPRVAEIITLIGSHNLLTTPTRAQLDAFAGVPTGFVADAMNGRGALDARIKPHHAPPLEEDPAVTQRVDRFFTSDGPLAGID